LRKTIKNNTKVGVKVGKFKIKKPFNRYGRVLICCPTRTKFILFWVFKKYLNTILSSYYMI